MKDMEVIQNILIVILAGYMTVDRKRLNLG